ncbi:MAG: PrsW family intramembrane metalloprotease [Chlorobi bacterium]|nr:PrsW family intramembrane metalloprotease [Chlorobiota bacterium]
MLAVFSLIFAVVPMVFYLWMVWLMDRYDREPIGLLMLHFLWGALGAVFFGIIGSIILSALVGTNEFGDAIFVAPVVEEITKGILLFATVRMRRFDNITDGIVYGMAIGLGFGMTENFLYFLSAQTVGDWVFLVIVRTLFSAVMHAMATGIFGAFVGATKFSGFFKRVVFRLLGLFIAMLMHFTWNYSVSINDPAAQGLGLVFILISVVIIFVILQIALAYESKLIRRELGEEVKLGIIPAEHLSYLPYSSKRRLQGWMPVADKKKEYIRLATELAFRRYQLVRCKENERQSYENDIERIRREIKLIFGVDETATPQTLF